MITVLGIDPGSVNAGYAVIRVRVKKNKLEYKLEECGKLSNLLKELKLPHKKELKAHVKEVKALVKKYGVDCILAERYMARGMKGSTIEAVNQMLGALEIGLAQEITQIPAATWKNQVNRKFDLKEFYKTVPVEAHEVDAVFQAVWLAEKKLGIDLLGKFTSIKKRNQLVKVITWKTTSQLKKLKSTKKR